jgi:hypothetical protein
MVRRVDGSTGDKLLLVAVWHELRADFGIPLYELIPDLIEIPRDWAAETLASAGAEVSGESSTGPRVRPSFAIPNDDDRVWGLFDWDAEGWQNFVSDPEVPAILQEAGHKGRPQAAELGGQYGD